jgi:hypothetical protein
MKLVYEKKGSPGSLEVAWTWFPYFIAADAQLIKDVDKMLTSKYRARELTDENLYAMGVDVIEAVCGKYDMPGLGDWIRGMEDVG